MAENMKLSAPWASYVKKVMALFEYDPDVTVQYNDDNKELILNVENETKCDALTMLMPGVVRFGNVELVIRVRLSDTVRKLDEEEMFKRAFAGNPVFHDAVHLGGTMDRTYVLFRPEVAQFYNDNLGSLYERMTMVYEDVAKDVFVNIGENGVSFCSSLLE